MITLYVLKGETGKRYVGITQDLPRRLREHRAQKSKGGQILGHFFVLHTETFPDYKAARLREKFLKSGQGRKWLKALESESEPPEAGIHLKRTCKPLACSNPARGGQASRPDQNSLNK